MRLFSFSLFFWRLIYLRGGWRAEGEESQAASMLFEETDRGAHSHDPEFMTWVKLRVWSLTNCTTQASPFLYSWMHLVLDSSSPVVFWNFSIGLTDFYEDILVLVKSSDISEYIRNSYSAMPCHFSKMSIFLTSKLVPGTQLLGIYLFNE